MGYSEHDLQKFYGLTNKESMIHRMKTDGFTNSEIAEYFSTSVQVIKNVVYSINQKMKSDGKNMIIITINQPTCNQERKAVAKMILSILSMDNEIPTYNVGNHTITLSNIPKNIGDIEFVEKNVLPFHNLYIYNDLDAEKKAKAIYETYIEKGGEKGKMGYGWAIKLFDKFYIKYDIIGEE